MSPFFRGPSSFFILVLFVFGALVPRVPVFASETDGTVNATNRYAWGENIGWIDFGTTNGNVHVTDDGLSGAALTENVGWIVLDDVANDGEGNLSGYAWGENVGWINFDPTNGGVTINSSGVFTGSALGENIGWIIFGTDFPVTTDWRPESSRASDDDDEEETPPPSSGGGGGGGLPSEAFVPIQEPLGNFAVSINSAAASTTAREVTLTLRGGSNTRTVRLSESSNFPEGFQVSYPAGANQIQVPFTFSAGEGVKVIYAQFCTEWGNCSGVFSDNILLTGVIPPPSVIDQITEVPGQIVEEIEDILQPIFLPTRPVTTPSEEMPPIGTLPVSESTTPEVVPPALQGIWNLSPVEAVTTFAQGSLPLQLLNLAEKFPTFEDALHRLNVQTVADIGKLRGVHLTFAGLAGRLGLSKPVPIAMLSEDAKARMPTGVVFASMGGELVDLSTAFSVTEEGKMEQSVSTVVGKTLHLAIKPESDAESIKGYVAFRANGAASPVTGARHTILSQLFGALPASAQEAPVKAPVVEERMVLLAFEYTDPDDDGIYTADIETPKVAGEYEIITVIEFNDPELGRKELRLVTVVDPEGYVYETRDGKETRIPGATVSLYWLDPETNEYVLWPAEQYQQRNPQLTDLRGTYSFLVPPGYYHLKIDAPGYPAYEGEAFEVTEGVGIHTNIELVPSVWRDILDWKVALLLVVTVLLFVNFYRDRRKKNR